MASPTPKVGAGRAGHDSSVTANPSAPHRPIEALLNTQSTTDVLAAAQRDPNAGNKRRNHRGGKKKKKNRRQSFLPTAAEEEDVPARPAHDLQEPASATAPRPSFYRLGRRGSRNLSETSLDSNALVSARSHCSSLPLYWAFLQYSSHTPAFRIRLCTLLCYRYTDTSSLPRYYTRPCSVQPSTISKYTLIPATPTSSIPSRSSEISAYPRS